MILRGQSTPTGGFTLLEILLSIVFFATAFLAVLEAMNIGLFASGTNQDELIAINLAQEKMEEIRNTAFDDIEDDARAAVSGFAAFEREVEVTIPQSGLKLVNVNVYWTVRGDELSANLVTYVSGI